MISFYYFNISTMQFLKTLLILWLAVWLTSCSWGKPPIPAPAPAPAPASSGTEVKTTDPLKTPEGAPVATNCTVIPPMDAAALRVYESGVSPTATPGSLGSGNIAFVNYTLRLCTADGKIKDTSRAADAKIGGIYQEGRPYEPFQTVIGSHRTVRGFEYGLIGMKKWEKKIIAVAPVDGYGEAVAGVKTEKKVAKTDIAPEFSIVLDASLFKSTVTETIKKEMLGDKAKDLKVGQTLTGGQNNDIPAKIIKITADEVIVEIDNSKNPFSGKELKPGVTADVEEWVTFTVKSVSGSGVTFDVVNKNSPFYGKYTVGTTAETPVGNVTLKEIWDKEVTIDIEPTKDELKTTLFFDVELVDIK